MLNTHAGFVLQVLYGFGLVAVATTKALQLLRLCHEQVTAHQVSQFKIRDCFNQLVDSVKRLIIFTLGNF